MARYTKSGSGSATKTEYSLPKCDNCPRINTSSSRSSTVGSYDSSILVSVIEDFSHIKQEVQKLQDEIKSVEPYYESSTKLNNTVRIVIILLMMVPLLQLLCCIGVVYTLGIEEKLSGLLKLFINGIGILSIVELIFGGVKLFLFDNRLGLIEKEIEELKRKQS